MSQDQCAVQALPLTKAQRVKRFVRGRISALQWELKLLFLRFAYRHLMRLTHYFGWHYAPIEPGPENTHHRWCRWCGMRGIVFERGPLRVAAKQIPSSEKGK